MQNNCITEAHNKITINKTLKLESGLEISNFDIAYNTYGTLNDTKSNVAQVNPTSATNLNFANKLAGKEKKKFKANKEQLAAKLKHAPFNSKELAAFVIKAAQEKTC